MITRYVTMSPLLPALFPDGVAGPWYLCTSWVWHDGRGTAKVRGFLLGCN